MGFTTPCFIRKNTETLRKKLEELGYEILNSGNTENANLIFQLSTGNRGDMN